MWSCSVSNKECDLHSSTFRLALTLCSFVHNMNTSLIFDRVLPYLVQGLLFGGVPPYILHVSSSQADEFRNGE